MGASLAIVAVLYLVGVSVYRWRLHVNARAPTVAYSAATIRIGAAGTSFHVDAFSLDVHEVSAGQYDLCYRAGACDEPAGSPDYQGPVLAGVAAGVQNPGNNETRPAATMDALHNSRCVFAGAARTGLAPGT